MKKTGRLIFPIILFLLAQNSFGQSSPLNTFINSYAKKHNFSGTILIQGNSKIAYARSFGLANRRHKIPNRIETKYKVASITKTFGKKPSHCADTTTDFGHENICSWISVEYETRL